MLGVRDATGSRISPRRSVLLDSFSRPCVTRRCHRHQNRWLRTWLATKKQTLGLFSVFKKRNPWGVEGLGFVSFTVSSVSFLGFTSHNTVMVGAPLYREKRIFTIRVSVERVSGLWHSQWPTVLHPSPDLLFFHTNMSGRTRPPL